MSEQTQVLLLIDLTSDTTGCIYEQFHYDAKYMCPDLNDGIV
jgi:hypothetical protein